ncbi:DUF4349 domain-containing protein [Costertonia aggregata]|uniref:DUF4349 domain-containing protein n=1 Tax=Costertonia aggregata TaxID=343403 RepID=A0A7H9AM31_9FLAO|nr:DUF4349 domain-containing protein [Costertonia aggregata]QLG44520.1 DUF4349 domain-containing protein [Costertonia aggregata]
MTPLVKKLFKKIIIGLSLLFVVLFVFRLLYGYQKKIAPTFQDNTTVLNESIPEVRKNYASKKYQVNSGSNAVRVDQKYEKIANINSVSTKFDTEEERIRKEIKGLEGLIQFENKNGNKGYRNLNLIIGVPPENFDKLYNNLIKIGTIRAKQITKKDKTNEYKELNAKKASLEKIRQSLIDLKTKGGRIDEYMQLENRILDIEQQLQDLSVSLGNFDDENEFCTVKFTLTEGAELKIGLMQRIKVALEWTIKRFLMLMIAFTFMTLFAYLLVLTIEKIRTKV